MPTISQSAISTAQTPPAWRPCPPKLLDDFENHLHIAGILAKNLAFQQKRMSVIFNSEGADARDTPAVVCAIVSTMDKCIPKLITNQGAICDFTIAVGHVYITGGKNINWPGIGSCGQGYYVLRFGANWLCG